MIEMFQITSFPLSPQLFSLTIPCSTQNSHQRQSSQRQKPKCHVISSIQGALSGYNPLWMPTPFWLPGVLGPEAQVFSSFHGIPIRMQALTSQVWVESKSLFLGRCRYCSRCSLLADLKWEHFSDRRLLDCQALLCEFNTSEWSNVEMVPHLQLVITAVHLFTDFLGSYNQETAHVTRVYHIHTQVLWEWCYVLHSPTHGFSADMS